MTFASTCLNGLFDVWQCKQWLIADVKETDKYGMDADDPDSQLDTSEDYTDYLPNEYRLWAVAMRYGKEWLMTMDAVLDMDYVEYVKRILVTKSITLRKPEYTKDDWFMQNTSSKYKPLARSKKRARLRQWRREHDG